MYDAAALAKGRNERASGALALFDDESRTNDVMSRLKKMGQWAIEAFTVCKMGPHERHEGELKSLIDNSKRLAQTIQVMS